MSHQIQLMRSRRFWPLFWAQFLGAFNDNVLKNAVIIMITYQGLTVWGLAPDAMSTFAPALLMAPYIVFSGVAGQMADRYSKSWLIRRVKIIEITVMLLAAVGFLWNKPQLLLVAILVLGLQATFFGPIKYSILPQLLHDGELVTGNALVEMGTNIAILIGTVAGGMLVNREVIGPWGPSAVSACLLALAVLGYLSTCFVPETAPEAPDLRLDLNPLTTTWDLCRQAFKVHSIVLSLLGIGWFWLYGSALVELFLPYAKNVLHANESVTTLFLALFSIGVAAGSLLCEKLSFDRLELGLVPFGSIGMTVFAADLCFAWMTQPSDGGQLLTIAEFLRHPGGARVVVDLVLLAMSSGFFIVPLYTFIQARAEPAARSRIIAANNVISSLFIVAWAGVQIVLLGHFTVTTIFIMVAVLNAAVALYIYTVIPEFFLRFVAYILTHIMYRVRSEGLENIPREGPAVIVCNHVSFIDWLILYGSIQRPVRFVMDHQIYHTPGFGKLLHDAKVIPIASRKEDPVVLEAAMDRIAEELEQGELVCIFPEGMITRTGEMGMFKHGVEQIVSRTPVPVVPMALRGLWGSFFSRKYGRAMTRPFRRFWSRIAVICGPPVIPDAVEADRLHDTVLALRGEQV
jgi:1-acyl-sn-glycerol-3-phosphate acyltransferase